jgi:putative hemolysin
MKHIVLSILVLLIASCTPTQALPESPTVPSPVPTDTLQANMPNPAAVYCEEQGDTYEIRTAIDGSQAGFCIFPDGSECDGWAYFRNECSPGQFYPSLIPTADNALAPTIAPTPFCAGPTAEGWSLYCHETLGLSFQYPQDATLELDASGYTVYVTGPVVDDNAWPVFMISFPGDRQDYRLPEGADLRQWLVEHNLLMDEPQPDATIADTIAVHTRFPGSPQAYADDRYFIAHEGQIYMIGIMHTGNLEDWELYNHFLESIQFVEPNAGL